MAETTARLDHVGLAVTDLRAACAWYCDVFGLVPELSLRVDAIDLSIEMLIHPAFGYRVELLHRPGTGAGAGPKPANPAEAALREGYGHVAFDVADLDGAFDRAVDDAVLENAGGVELDILCFEGGETDDGFGWQVFCRDFRNLRRPVRRQADRS